MRVFYISQPCSNNENLYQQSNASDNYYPMLCDGGHII